MTHTCSTCRRELEESAFWWQRGRPKARCKACERAARQTPSFKAKRRARRRRYAAANPEKVAAQSAVHEATRAGRLTKQPCEVCGAAAEAHHDDYSKPLDVRWLCQFHHAAHHQRRVATIPPEYVQFRT